LLIGITGGPIVYKDLKIIFIGYTIPIEIASFGAIHPRIKVRRTTAWLLVGITGGLLIGITRGLTVHKELKIVLIDGAITIQVLGLGAVYPGIEIGPAT
jgi:hypothetical protein